MAPLTLSAPTHVEAAEGRRRGGGGGVVLRNSSGFYSPDEREPSTAQDELSNGRSDQVELRRNKDRAFSV